MAAATNWANLPMPPGWQSVWDSTQNRYFFIDHSTKTTTWIDPREALWKQQNMPVQSAAQYSPYAGRAQPASQIFEMMPVADKQTHRQHWTHELTPAAGSSWFSSREDVAIEETMFAQGIREANRREDLAGSRRSSSNGRKLTLMKLKAEFPETERELISDLLESNHGNERETRKVLIELGYKHRTAPPSRTQSPSGGNTPRAFSPSHTQSPSGGSASRPLSPSRAKTPPVAVQLTKSEKTNLKQKLQREFQSVSQTVVEMALEVSMYDEAKTRSVLHSQSRQAESSISATNNGAPQSRRSSTQQFDRKEVSHSRSVTPSYGSTTRLYGSGILETSLPVGDSAPSRSPTPVGVLSSSSSATATINGHSATPHSHSATPRDTSPARHTKRPAHKAPVTKSRPARAERQKKSPAIKKQPDYVSSNRTLAKGPDPTLVVGPQIHNLLGDYEFAVGPDHNNVKGPDARNRVGPCAIQRTRDLLARGPDPYLRHGPHG